MHKRILCAIALLVMVTGCMTVGPNYKRPDIVTPPSWRFEVKEARDLANTAWWEQFNDPVLNNLIRTALEENKELLIATARIEEFFGRYFSTRGNQFPLAGGNADAFHARVSEKNTVQPIEGENNPYNYYDAFLNGSWEIDFWGKFRRATEAALRNLPQKSISQLPLRNAS